MPEERIETLHIISNVSIPDAKTHHFRHDHGSDDEFCDLFSYNNITMTHVRMKNEKRGRI